MRKLLAAITLVLLFAKFGQASTFIQLRGTLQSGATFYVSSGTVVNLKTTTLKFNDGTTQTSGASASTFIQNTATLQSGATFYVSSGTVNSFTAATSFMPPVYSSMTIGIVQGTASTSSTTAVTAAFVPSNLSATITPRFTTSRVKISIMASMQSSTNDQSCWMSILRGTTELSGTNGFGFYGNNSSSGTRLAVPWTISWIDSPGTTSATTYTMAMKAGGVVTCITNPTSSTISVMILEELR